MTVTSEGRVLLAVGGAFPLCAAHDLEVDGIGFRLGPTHRLPDGAYGIPVFIWDAFTGSEIDSAELVIDRDHSTATWRRVPS